MSVSSNDKPNIVQVSEDNLTVTVISSIGVPGAKGSYTVSATTPSSPSAGDVWFNSDDGRTYIRYNDGNTTQWVEFGNANIGGSFGTYTDYTPTISNITLGNATVTAKYASVNKMVHYYGVIVFGSTTSVTGTAFNLSLPINCSTLVDDHYVPIGSSGYLDVSSGAVFSGDIIGISSTTVVRLRIGLTISTYSRTGDLSSTIPFTWDTGDKIQFSMVYEAA